MNVFVCIENVNGTPGYQRDSWQSACSIMLQKMLSRYTSGDVRLWDTLHWESGALNLQPSHSIRAETTPPQINLVQVTDSVACAAYENGERFESLRSVSVSSRALSKIRPNVQAAWRFGALNPT